MLKRIITAAALLAIAGPAMAQVHVQTDVTVGGAEQGRSPAFDESIMTCLHDRRFDAYCNGVAWMSEVKKEMCRPPGGMFNGQIVELARREADKHPEKMANAVGCAGPCCRQEVLAVPNRP